MTEVSIRPSVKLVNNKRLLYHCKCDRDAFRARVFDISAHHRLQISESRKKINDYKKEIRGLFKRQNNLVKMLEYRWYEFLMEFDDEKNRWDIDFGLRMNSELAEENKMLIQDQLNDINDTRNALEDRIRGCEKRIKNWEKKCQGNNRVVKSLVKDLQAMLDRKMGPQLDRMRETYTLSDWESVLKDVRAPEFVGLYQTYN